jgi:hypothetical protein
MSLSDVSMQILHFLHIFLTHLLLTLNPPGRLLPPGVWDHLLFLVDCAVISLLKTPLYSAKILKSKKERKRR